MTDPSKQPPAAPGACPECLRRSWLLGEMSALLDYHRGDPARLGALLELEGTRLIDGRGGSRRRALREAWSEFSPQAEQWSGSGGTVCPHTAGWSGLLAGVKALPMLALTCSPGRLEGLLRAPRVAILGPRRASPYGEGVAGSLARGLAAAGVTVTAPIGGGLGEAVHDAVAALGAGSIGLAGDGLKGIAPASAARLAGRVGRRGCVASGLPSLARGRGWGTLAAQRACIALGDLAIVVEGDDGALSADAADTSRKLGRPLGAVPGPLTSRLSTSPHGLIRGGVELIRGPEDVLEMLHGAGRAPGRVAAQPRLRRELRTVLERVGAGEDRAEQLVRGDRDAGLILASLGELEAMGLVARLPGGRYLATPLPLE